jgi:hypothetical protein
VQGFYLKHQNKALSTELYRYKRNISELSSRLRAAQAKEQSLAASHSIVCRAWDLLEADLQALSASLVGPTSNTLGEGGKSAADGQKTTSLWENILSASVDFASLAANDAKALEQCGVTLPSSASNGDDDGHLTYVVEGMPHNFVSGVTGDDSNGNGETHPSPVQAEVDAKAQFTRSLMESLISALREAIGSKSDASQEVALGAMHAHLLAEKRRLESEVGFLHHSLVSAHQKVLDLESDLKAARYDRHRALRKLDKLAASGVEIPEDTVVAESKGLAVTGPPPAQSLNSGVARTSAADDAEGKGLPAYPAGPTAPYSGPAGAQTSSGEADTLKLEMKELQKVSATRLEEANRLRNEKLELEKALTKVTAGEEGGSLPEVTRIKSLLEAEHEKLELTQQRLSVVERKFEEEKAKVRFMDEGHPKEMEAQRVRWNGRMEENLMLLQQVQQELDVSKASLEISLEESKQASAMREQLKEYDVLVKGLEAEVMRLNSESERKHKQIEDLEARAGASGGGNLGAQLASVQGVNDALMSEVETTAKAYREATEQSARLLRQQQSDAESTSQLTNELLRLKQQLELHQQERGALDLKVHHADQVKAQANEYVAQAKEQLAALETALVAERDCSSSLRRELHDEQTRALQARGVAEGSAAELHKLQARMTALQTRCDSLVEDAEAARVQERQAKEASSAAQRKAERRLSKCDDSLQGEEITELRRILRCSVCSSRQKDCIIAKCFHMFCRECVDENLRTRHRKCPACNKGFGADDVHAIYL